MAIFNLVPGNSNAPALITINVHVSLISNVMQFLIIIGAQCMKVSISVTNYL